jgi:hypothetical protein
MARRSRKSCCRFFCAQPVPADGRGWLDGSCGLPGGAQGIRTADLRSAGCPALRRAAPLPVLQRLVLPKSPRWIRTQSFRPAPPPCPSVPSGSKVSPRTASLPATLRPTSQHSFRIAARSLPGALGRAEACRREHLFDLDGWASCVTRFTSPSGRTSRRQMSGEKPRAFDRRPNWRHGYFPLGGSGHSATRAKATKGTAQCLSISSVATKKAAPKSELQLRQRWRNSHVRGHSGSRRYLAGSSRACR